MSVPTLTYRWSVYAYLQPDKLTNWQGFCQYVGYHVGYHVLRLAIHQLDCFNFNMAKELWVLGKTYRRLVVFYNAHIITVAVVPGRTLSTSCLSQSDPELRMPVPHTRLLPLREQHRFVSRNCSAANHEDVSRGSFPTSGPEYSDGALVSLLQ